MAKSKVPTGKREAQKLALQLNRLRQPRTFEINGRKVRVNDQDDAVIMMKEETLKSLLDCVGKRG
jgi:hypothetical protein